MANKRRQWFDSVIHVTQAVGSLFCDVFLNSNVLYDPQDRKYTSDKPRLNSDRGIVVSGGRKNNDVKPYLRCNECNTYKAPYHFVINGRYETVCRDCRGVAQTLQLLKKNNTPKASLLEDDIDLVIAEDGVAYFSEEIVTQPQSGYAIPYYCHVYHEMNIQFSGNELLKGERYRTHREISYVSGGYYGTGQSYYKRQERDYSTKSSLTKAIDNYTLPWHYDGEAQSFEEQGIRFKMEIAWIAGDVNSIPQLLLSSKSWTEYWRKSYGIYYYNPPVKKSKYTKTYDNRKNQIDEGSPKNKHLDNLPFV